MRYHTIFYASLLPIAVLAQPTVPLPSGVAHHSGVPLGRNSTGHNATHPVFPGYATAHVSPSDGKHHQPTAPSTGLSPKQSSNDTGIFTKAIDTSKHRSATGKLHKPHSKPTEPLFVNDTRSYGPTGTGGVASSTTGFSAELGKPTETGSISVQSANSVKPVTPSTGRLPIPVSKGATPHFTNGTTFILAQHETSTPHTSSSGIAVPTGSGHAASIGASSGFAKPTSGSHNPVPGLNSSIQTSKSVRLPITKSNGFHFSNSTSFTQTATRTGASGFVKPTNFRTVSGFPAASGYSSDSKPSRPRTSSNSITLPAATGTISSEATTVLSAATVIPTPSRHLPYTKSVGLVFSNGTSATNPTASTGVLSTKLMATAPHSTGTAPLYAKPTTTLSINSASSNVRTGSFSTDISATGIKSSAISTESATTFATFSASSTQSISVLASASPGLNSTISTMIYASTGGLTSALASVPTTMVTAIFSTGLVASTGFASSTSSPVLPSHVVIPQYYQCGGINFKGKGSCTKGSVCKKWNPYYYQCVDEKFA